MIPVSISYLAFSWNLHIEENIFSWPVKNTKKWFCWSSANYISKASLSLTSLLSFHALLCGPTRQQAHSFITIYIFNNQWFDYLLKAKQQQTKFFYSLVKLTNFPCFMIPTRLFSATIIRHLSFTNVHHHLFLAFNGSVRNKGFPTPLVVRIAVSVV